LENQIKYYYIPEIVRRATIAAIKKTFPSLIVYFHQALFSCLLLRFIVEGKLGWGRSEATEEERRSFKAAIDR
jgi:hypothetical protein